MERRFQVRMREMLDQCRVQAGQFNGLLERLREFAQPFVNGLGRREQKQHVQTYLQGLLSNLERKNVESIAYHHDQERLNLQRFIGCSCWDHRPLIAELARQVGTQIGEDDGVIVFDPSGHPKRGRESVGVQRQWLGRLGKVDNGQVGVYLGYASRREHALVDTRLYLPKSWAQDKLRRRKCGVPGELRSQTRQQLALEMLDQQGPFLPHGWVSGDDEMGRSSWFRSQLRKRSERYLLAVPANTTIRDLEAAPPPWSGQGRKPLRRFEAVQDWSLSLAPDAWKRLTIRDGEKGPLELALVQRRVQARTEGRRVGPEELLVVAHSTDEQGRIKQDYYLSNASSDTSLEELGRVIKAQHRIEECLQRAKSEAGLSDYEVRTYHGWYHHQTLSLLATWFLTLETRREKKADAGHDGAAGADGVGVAAA